jgi:hypothetical protein
MRVAEEMSRLLGGGDQRAKVGFGLWYHSQSVILASRARMTGVLGEAGGSGDVEVAWRG